MKKKVIVIGAGIGGLSIAARLLFKGFDVEILEKNNTIGGKTNILKSGNFKFDLTASIPMFYKDYIDIFNFCQKDYRKYFSFITLDINYRCFYPDKSYYDFSNNFASLANTINRITKNNIKDKVGFYNFLTSSYNKYLIANNTFLNRGFYKKTSFLNPKLIYNGIKLKVTTSSISNCRKYISNKKLINYLMFQTMYIGASPYESSNIYNSIPASSQLEGLAYIKGGMYSYIKALQKLILDYGGHINTLRNVDKILFNKNKAIGVIQNGTASYADIVICTSDYSYSINNLIKDINIKNMINPTETFKYSCSTFILYLALNKKYPILKVNNIFINKNFKKNIQAAFKGSLPLNPSLYIYCPSSIDLSICPNKYEELNVLVRVPNLLYKKITWSMSTINKLKSSILDTLSNIESLEDIKEHIIYDNYLTPLDLRDRFNSFAGCAFGLSHSLDQSILFRPQCTIPQIKNLYFTGSSIHPGNGVSTVLKSSKICCDRICKDHILDKKINA
ncbi:phytoene desaturase family protein [Clostridium sp. SHJSY1]|uniref:phytoene desaturase family protein n=1 Tax=Clostridium sp. SHJSY1 TaxID=2942483 RepID=UPI00287687EA|nr:phytoene desaturase family protein [Clostridium sp. SHJSY1]MDS0524564.1 phytoene desaturase family protein [Clostridium sp. SHJSY1]